MSSGILIAAVLALVLFTSWVGRKKNHWPRGKDPPSHAKCVDQNFCTVLCHRHFTREGNYGNYFHYCLPRFLLKHSGRSGTFFFSSWLFWTFWAVFDVVVVAHQHSARPKNVKFCRYLAGRFGCTQVCIVPGRAACAQLPEIPNRLNFIELDWP